MISMPTLLTGASTLRLMIVFAHSYKIAFPVFFTIFVSFGRRSKRSWRPLSTSWESERSSLKKINIVP